MKKVKMISVFCMALALLFYSVPGNVIFSKEAKSTVTEGNAFTLTAKDDFKNGNVENLVVGKEKGGQVSLAKDDGKYASKGSFTSKAIYTEPFSNLIASWDSQTPEGTSINVEAQVLVDGEWSSWITWGTWGTNQENSSVDDSDDFKLAGIWTDTLYVKNDKTANAFKLRVTLNSDDSKTTPVLRAVNATIDLGYGANRIYPSNEDKDKIENVDKQLDVPAFSQMIRDPQIKSRICSPTSCTCVVDYYLNKHNKDNVLPEESAYTVYDKVYDGFGNWAFSASYIGSFGLDGKVEFCDSLYDLKREIYKGNPVVISVNHARSENDTDPEDAKYPLLHGFPILATNGHLITVTGFTKKDGKEYVCVNDSAAASDAEAKRMYLADEFDKAWATSGRVAYTVSDSEEKVYNPIKRLKASFDEMSSADNKDSIEYSLIYKGQIVDLSSANAKVIMVSKDGGAYEYITPGTNKNLSFSADKESGKYKFLIIAKAGKEYTGSIKIKE
ncbi:C39 family peptidase [Clostridium oryzae]|uniref:Peptidase C39-like domain-containing protein n=1 Tax=Clostridium oryzae TaxID=1450648 RepID=A0A1V4IJQ5_9CLOT|nr:C39 family peptidase [Clostridium oryzae]OPJ59975.1 hypothetical protein CLORY_30670 [Clostridium oryzae]